MDVDVDFDMSAAANTQGTAVDVVLYVFVRPVQLCLMCCVGIIIAPYEM